MVHRVSHVLRARVTRGAGPSIPRKGLAPKRVTNTRDDKVQSKFWKDSFEKRRCLVPATAFCEPDEGKPARMEIVQSGFEKKDLLAAA